jgi:Short C-terminal domain
MSEESSDPRPTTPHPPPQPPARASAGRRWSIRVLLAVGMVLAFVSVFAVWANRQLLSADNWTKTSTDLLANPAIRTQVSGFVVDQVYANVDVPAQLKSALPPRLAPLAGPAANGLRDLAERTTYRALGRPRVQQAWAIANHTTAEQLIRVIKDESRLITTNGNAVILDLRPVVLQIAARLGLPASVTSKIPPTAGKIQVLKSDQLSTLQTGAKALNALATILPVLALICLGLAVFLDRGRRRVTLLWAGIDLVAAGVLALVARSLIGDQVVSTLATTDAVKPAVEATWTIGTQMLVDIAQAVIIAAVPLLLAALLAGPSRPAVALRRAAAPWLRDRPGLVYTAEAVLVLLIVAWGPIPATRKVLPVLVMTALLVFGVEVLRRQAAREFPDATAEDTRERVVAQFRRMGAGRPAATNGGLVHEDAVDELERIAKLHDRGVLDDAEFNSAKHALLPR